MTFGERIVSAREVKGINQKQLAEILKITPTRLNYWEKDKRQPDVFMIKALAEALDTTGDYLIGNDTAKSKNKKTFDPKEKSIIGKYRTLDEHGRKVIDTILDIEVERIESYIHRKQLLAMSDESRSLANDIDYVSPEKDVM